MMIRSAVMMVIGRMEGFLGYCDCHCIISQFQMFDQHCVIATMTQL